MDSNLPAGDTAHDVVRAIVLGSIEGIPFAGGLLSAGVSGFWQSRSGRRLMEFIEDLEEFITQTEVDLDELRDLASQPHRQEVMQRALAEGLLSADEDHRERCRAAFINGMAGDTEETIALRCSQLLGDLTPAHFEILAAVAESQDDAAAHVAARAQRRGMSEMTVRMIANDLARSQLIARIEVIDGNSADPDATRNKTVDEEFLNAIVAPLGAAMIDFVTVPEAER